MSIVLLVLGVLAAGAGAVMVGFGVPINEFSLGNTLIVAGTTALVGGLVVIALSLATRQLIRIAALLKNQPLPRPGRGEGYDTGSEGPGSGRMPFPPRPMPDSGPRHPESRFAPPPPPGGNAPNDPIFDRLRMNPQSGHGPQGAARNGDTPMLHDEEAPLSPRAPRTPMPAEQQPDDSALARMLRGGEQTPAPAPKPAEKARNGATPPPVPAAPPRQSFNDVWPDEPAPSRSAPDPFAARASDPFTRMPEPPAPPAARNGSALRDAIMREQEHANVPVSILKSGVVDGMAYTLYTDGSIEAELAQGVVRFGSIEELRNHLEKSH